MPLLLCTAFVASFFFTGDAWLGALAPGGDAAQRLVLGAWLGLASFAVALCSLYFFAPLWTVQALALPLLTVTVLAGLASRRFYPRQRGEALGLLGWGSLVIPSLMVLLLAAPLLGLHGLGFYFSDNGEFANYAAIGDITQYHPSNTEIHWLSPIQTWYPLASREAVIGLLCAQASSLIGSPTLWVIQPLSWALAWIALASLGLLLRDLARHCQASLAARCLILLLYAWAALSASSQRYWSFSWMSQYLSLALFNGCVLCLTLWNGPQASVSTLRARSFILGLALAAMACAYPELFTLNVLMLSGLSAAMAWGAWRARARSTWLPLALGLGLAGLLGNRFALGVLLARIHSSAALPSGWNVYGDHRQPLNYLGNLLGLSNIFLDGGPNLVHVSLAAFGLLLALVLALRELGAGREPALRGLAAGTLALAAGTAALFVLVGSRGGTNYAATKFILQYQAFAYLAVALLLARLRRPSGLLLAALLMAVISRDLAKTSWRFARHLREDSRAAVFEEDDTARCQAALGPGSQVYVASVDSMENFKIIGKFLAYGHDLFAKNDSWPANDPRPYDPSQTVILIGSHSQAKDDKSLPQGLTPFFSGPCYTLLRRPHK